MTIGEKYGPAMSITDQEEADKYFEKCVEDSMSHGLTREEAEKVERYNFGYYAGYCGPETQARIEKLFRCSHPLYHKIGPK